MLKVVFVLSIIFSLGAINFGQEERIKTYSETTNKTLSKNVFSESRPDRSIEKKVSKIKNNLPEKSANDDEIKIDATLVTIPVSVSSSTNGKYVSNLAKEEFKVFEDGVEQEISYFGTFDKPFTVILILDTSPSTEYKIEEIQDAAKFFVDQLKPNDRVEIIKFNKKIRVLAKATRNRQKIYAAIEKARFSSGTSLYDVVDFALEKRLKRVIGRKAIVIFTDGVDTTSSDAFFEDTVKQAELSDTLIFPVYYNTSSEMIGKRKKTSKRNRILKDYKFAKMYLQDLATTTGGRVISPEESPDGLNEAFRKIAEDLSYQYNIGYYPQNDGTPGERKKIKVRIYRPNLNVRARDNYIVKPR